MQLIKRNVPNAGYEQFDIVAVAADDHQWSPLELAGNFVIETGTTLTDSDKSLLLMSDEKQTNINAIGKLPAFRSLSTSKQFSKQLHRRKYQHSGGVNLKGNAQDGT